LQDVIRKPQSSEQSGCCARPADFVQSYGMQYESENSLSGVTFGNFSQKIPAKSVTKGERFHQDIWLWKSGTGASGPQVCWQTVAGHSRVMYLKPITREFIF